MSSSWPATKYCQFLFLDFLFLSSNLFHTTNRGTATNGDEYVPVIVPINKANEKYLTVAPPNKVKITSIIIIVKELLIDRFMVSLTERLAKGSNFSWGNFL